MIRALNDECYKKDIIKMAESRSIDENVIIAMEECSELQKSISKMWRRQKDGKKVEDEPEIRESLVEEIADVLICIDAIKVIFRIDDGDVDAMIKEKNKRNLQRLSEKTKVGMSEAIGRALRATRECCGACID